MEEKALQIFDTHTVDQLERLSKCQGDEFARIYIGDNLTLIGTYGKYLGFLSYRYRNHPNEPQIIRKHRDSFYSIAWNNAGIPSAGMRYLDALVMLVIRKKTTGTSGHENWETVWKKGFATEAVDRLPDFDRLLKDASVVDYGIFKADPLMNAVFETVMEEAGYEISLGRVAKKAGLTKSSLYNYWPGKDAMLADVLERQIALFCDLYIEFSEKYSDPADRLFSYIAFAGSFLRRSPEIINYLQRFMSYEIRIPKQKSLLEEYFIQTIKPILDDGLINLRGYSAKEFLGLVNLACVIEIKHNLTEDSVRIQIEQGLKDLYRLISGGISALRRTI